MAGAALKSQIRNQKSKIQNEPAKKANGPAVIFQ